MKTKVNRKSTTAQLNEIAVIGLGCWYPGANNIPALWHNILGSKQQFRRMPDVRLPIAEYSDPDKLTPDKTYGTQAAVVDGYEFDWAGKRIPKSAYESCDIVHWFALDVALQALTDAGYDSTRLPKETTQVVIGNTLTGEFTRSNTMRLRWPYVEKTLMKTARDLGYSNVDAQHFAQAMEARFKSVFAPVNEDTLAGGLANTIAGRVCNFLDVNGGGFTVDGACSSSLIAIYTAAANLANGSCDFAIAGGVDVSLDPFELIGFAKTGALTPSQMAVYDKRGNGFIPGEGAGFVALKRLADAKRDGDYIYAVLDGWGMSSDGKGGITAPSVRGQSIALRRAYEMAGASADDITFIEGHGTGTAVGDKTELLGIAKAFSDIGGAAARNCGITSFKSIVGHTKAAAGIGAFIKTALSLNQRVIPPTAGCELPHDVFSDQVRALYPVMRGKALPADTKMRAGVSAMGFGGINVHVTLRPGDTAKTGLEPVIGVEAALVSKQDSEVFFIAAPTQAALNTQLTWLRESARGISVAQVVDLAAHLARTQQNGHFRAAISARTPNELEERLTLLAGWLVQPLKMGHILEDKAKGICAGNFSKAPRLGFVFPGQGSQRLNAARSLIKRFSWAEELVGRADKWASEQGTQHLAATLYPDLDKFPVNVERDELNSALRQTDLAQPAIVVSSLLWLEFLKRLGLSGEAFMGHSLGELTAFYASGAFDEEALIKLACVRGQLMAEPSATLPGSMLSLAADATACAQLLATIGSSELVIANLNSKLQTIVSGSQEAIEQLEKLASAKNIQNTRLKVSQAFHSPMVAHAAARLGELAPIPRNANSFSGTVISSATAAVVNTDLDLKLHFSDQITKPVNFIHAAQTFAEFCDLALEVGPGAVLSNLSTQIDGAVTLLPIEPQAEAWTDCNYALANLFVRGADIDRAMLFEQRLVSPFVTAANLQFIVNPCEREQRASTFAKADSPQSLPSSVMGISESYWNSRGEFIRAVIAADQKALGVVADLSAPIPAVKASNSGISLAVPQVTASQTMSATNVLLKLVADFTGFSQASLFLDMRLVDDLNLDSIKAADLIQSITAALSLGALDSAEYSNARLSDFIALAPQQISSIAEKKVASDVQSVILQLVADTTGFDINQFNPGQRLLDDLNLDSIKANDLVARIRAKLDIQGELPALDLMSISLGELSEQFVALLPQGPTTTDVPLSEPHSAFKIVMSATAALTGFNPDHLQPQLTLTDDLNLDSIKLASLLAQITESAGLKSEITSQLAGTITGQHCLQDLIDATAQHLEKVPASSAIAIANTQPKPALKDAVKTGAKESWVRSFAMKLVAREIVPSQVSSEELAQHSLGVLCSPDDYNSGTALADALRARGVQASLHAVGDADLLSNSANTSISNWVVFTGESAQQSGTDLQQAIALRHAAAVLSAGPHSRSISFIQRNGLEAEVNAVGDYKSAATSAFAASLHLERAKLKVRVLDYAELPSFKTLADQVITELYTDGHYQLSHYTVKGARLQQEAVVIEPADCASRAVTIDSADWVLVTGGAKGITAECGLVLARQSKAKMLLLGSSAFDPQKDHANEIATTLAAYKAEGLTAHYLSCNLADANSLHSALRDFEQANGAITVVVHGAGTNQPRRAETVSVTQAAAEIAPKLNGVINLCDYFASKPPKLFVALTSIIGVTGMAGNAWYAYSNEAVNLHLQGFNQVHPSCEIASLAYSVWDEVGMGARMGSVNHLAKMGIDAIPPALGIKAFLSACYQSLPAAQVVVASRLGTLDTWVPTQVVAPEANRYLGKQLLVTPGVERVADIHLSLADDLYLKDHYYQGVYLFPTVMGLEAMAQNVAAVLGLDRLPGLSLHDIKLERPIIVDPQKGANIRIQVVSRPRETEADSIWVDAAIFTEHTQYHRPHFAASFNFVSPLAGDSSLTDWPVEKADVNPQTELYGGMLFQGPLFQHMDSVWRMDEARADFCVARFPAEFFAKQFSQSLILGDPGYRDVLLQSAQLCEKDTYLPVNIARLDIYTPPSCEKELFNARISVIERPDQYLVCNLSVYTVTGDLIESMDGYRLKRMRQNLDAPTPSDWVNPGVRDQAQLQAQIISACNTLKLASPVINLHFMPKLSTLERSMRRVMELPLINQLVCEVTGASQLPEMQMHWREDGRPYVTGTHLDVDLSISHNSSHCLLVAGRNLQGCDIEDITERTAQQWSGLLGEPREALLNLLKASGDDLDTAGTRIWSLMESAKKSLGSENSHYSLLKHHDGSVLFKAEHQGNYVFILTLATQFTRPGRKMVAMVVELLEEKIRASEPKVLAAPAINLSYDDMKAGPGGQPKPCFRFRVTFKDASSLSAGVLCPTYADWMGSIRELSIVNIAKDLVPDFSSGRWGLVTNYSDIQIFGEAECLDLIEGRMYLSRSYGQFGSSIDMHFEWVKIGNDGTETQIALTNMATTWVEITGHGIVEVKPFPVYLQQFIDEYLPSQQVSVQARKNTLAQHLAALGKCLYQAPVAPKIEPELSRLVFNTSSAESNLVGNIYYANYYHWQNRIIDRYFQALNPKLYTQQGWTGEFQCLRSEINHLREAMPYDNIEVVMALQGLYESAVQLHFDYYKVEADGKRTKLAYGIYEALWVPRSGNDLAKMPDVYLHHLLQLNQVSQQVQMLQVEPA
jgi:enediyne polyketide synthase